MDKMGKDIKICDVADGCLNSKSPKLVTSKNCTKLVVIIV